MFCIKCGLQLPDDAVFCVKCGVKQTELTPTKQDQTSIETKEVKCPNCSAPIQPKFAEMVITCEYCGSSVSLENKGWEKIAKHSMLPIVILYQDQITMRLHQMMDKGFLHRHLQENSTLEELSLSMIPFWVFPATAETNITVTDLAAEVGGLAATAAMAGLMSGGLGGSSRRGGLESSGIMGGMLLGTMMGGGMTNHNITKAYTVDEIYNCPIIAVKSLSQYQSHGYEFSIEQKIDFDLKKIPKTIKILNGDINEDVAKNMAKNIVDQMQSQKVHAKYHMIREMQTHVEVTSAELLHVPIWFAQYSHKGKKIILIVDANSGNVINSIGL